MTAPGTTDQGILGDESHLHPALVGAALHRGHVGADEIAATLVHLIAGGMIAARNVTVDSAGIFGRAVRRQTVELRLVSGKASERHHSPHDAHLVRQGHVDGLCKIDRCLLSAIFDRIAHAEHVTLLDVGTFKAEHPASYWSVIQEWRELVVDTVREGGLLDEGAYTGKAGDLRRLRCEIRARIRSGRPVTDPSQIRPGDARLLELAVLFGYEGALSRALRFPPPSKVDTSPSAGVPNSMRWLHGAGVSRMMRGWRP